MSDRIRVTVEAPGVSLHFEGSTGLYEEAVRDALRPIAEGRWKGAARAAGTPGNGPAGPSVPEPAASGGPGSPEPAPPLRAAPPPAAAAAPARAPVPPPAPVPAPSGSPARAPAWDPGPLYGRLAKENSRRGERDAVLAALVTLAGQGRRDASAPEVLDHLTSHGFPTKGLKAKPILQKLVHRTSFVEPGILPATFRATPAGSAHVWKRSREG